MFGSYFIIILDIIQIKIRKHKTLFISGDYEFMMINKNKNI